MPAKYQQLITGEINRILREMNRPTLEDDKNREETKQQWPQRMDSIGMHSEESYRGDSLGRKESVMSTGGPYSRKDSMISLQQQVRKDSVNSQLSTPLSSQSDMSFRPMDTADTGLARKSSVSEFKDDFDNFPIRGTANSAMSP